MTFSDPIYVCILAKQSFTQAIIKVGGREKMAVTETARVMAAMRGLSSGRAIHGEFIGSFGFTARPGITQ
jgi:hypothetical protein